MEELFTSYYTGTHSARKEVRVKGQGGKKSGRRMDGWRWVM